MAGGSSSNHSMTGGPPGGGGGASKQVFHPRHHPVNHSSGSNNSNGSSSQNPPRRTLLAGDAVRGGSSTTRVVSRKQRGPEPDEEAPAATWNIRSVLSEDCGGTGTSGVLLSLQNSEDGKTEIVLTTNTTEQEDAVSTTNDGSTGHEMVDRTLSMVDGGFSVTCKDASFICAPYKEEVFKNQIEEHNPGSMRRNAIIGALQDMGVKVFIIDSVSTPTTADVIHHVRRVVGYIARENRVLPKTGPLGYQRCLLYQDHQGRLFNLLLSQHAVGPASRWHEYIDVFSGLEAMIAIVVLCRSFPCVTRVGSVDQLKPAYLSLILGLVLTEEISLSWLNTSMMVRAAPSISAHTLTSPIGSDVLRKVIVLLLALASAATGMAQQVIALAGIAAAIIVLFANLGARSWYFMKWKPQRYDGPGAMLLAYFSAVVTGLVLPYMGHRNIETGGKAAMEYVIRTAFLVAAAFIISDIDKIQAFLVVGSEACPQDHVNIVIGVWWFATLICSLFLVRKVPLKDLQPPDAERLLEEDHASPAGYRIRGLPDFEIDPALARTGAAPCLSLNMELAIGILMAVGLTAGMIYLSFTDWDETISAKISQP